jgi:membrane-associated phospholipid phosphatase
MASNVVPRSRRRRRQRRPSAGADDQGPATQPGIGRRLLHAGSGMSVRLLTCFLVLIYFHEGYSWGYRSHTGPGVIDAALPIDAWIPMIPEFIVFYMLGYLFVLVPCVMVRDRHAFYAASVAFCVLLTVAFLIFRLAPVHMDKSYAVGSDWFSRLARFQQTKDTPYNNFPSLHVALNVYAYALIVWQSRRISAWWLPLPVLIICSTLLVKQHLFIDVIGGLLTAWAGFALFLRLEAASGHTAFRLWLLVQGLMIAVVATHLERLGKTVANVERFLAAGGVSLGEAGTALLLFILVSVGIRALSGRVGGRSPAATE